MNGRVAWAALLAVCVCVPTVGCAREAEKVSSPATSERRLADLEAAAKAFYKLPHIEEHMALVKAARACLWDKNEAAYKKAVALLKECGTYYCREELVAFTYKFERLVEKDRRNHGKAYRMCLLALLEIDLKGTFDYRSQWDIQFDERTPEDKARFLRATYWTERHAGFIVSWVVPQLAVVNHELANEALLVIKKDIERQMKSKAMGGWVTIELLPALTNSLQLNNFIRKAGSVKEGVATALKENDLKFITFVIKAVSQLDGDKCIARGYLESERTPALGYHAAGMEGGGDGQEDGVGCWQAA